jgi:1-deoxy-D-xylulose-5-phosphate reductoisomerase
LPPEQFAAITPEQALKHPTWVMGRRITIDSATMLNKGLEIIEACRLFDVPPSQVRVIVHPQSTVHSLVEYVDGSILAQISVTDMRLPILYALAWPERPASTLTFDLASLRHLDFEPPDFERFPCLRLSYEAAEKGGAHAIALNAADELAVEASLLWESRVQLRRCLQPRRRPTPPRSRKCWPPIGKRVKQRAGCWTSTSSAECPVCVMSPAAGT